MRTFLIILLSLLLLIIGLYLLLPYFLTRYINRELQNLEEYEGRIEGVDLELFRGGFTINNLEINKVEGEVPVPFVRVASIESTIEWRALLKGKVVSEVYFNEPMVNFVTGPTEEQSQYGDEVAWHEVLQEVVPFQINRLEIRNGTLHYRDFHAEPQVNIPLKQLNLVALNLTNVEQVADSLPSSIEMSAVSIGGGQVGLDGRLNLLKELADFDLKFKMENMQLTSINDFTEAYAKFTFEEGVFSLFSEMKMQEGRIGGYVRPIMEGVQILNLQEEDQGILRKAWEGLLEVTQRLFRNRPKERFATQVPVSGHIENVDVGVWTTVLNIFRNAFIEAFTKSFAGEDSGEEEEQDKSDRQQRREERREERRERREQRQQERTEKKQEKEATKKE